MYHQLNIHIFYVLPTHCIYVFSCGSQNKQPLFPYTTLTDQYALCVYQQFRSLLDIRHQYGSLRSVTKPQYFRDVTLSW